MEEKPKITLERVFTRKVPFSLYLNDIELQQTENRVGIGFAPKKPANPTFFRDKEGNYYEPEKAFPASYKNPFMIDLMAGDFREMTRTFKIDDDGKPDYDKSELVMYTQDVQLELPGKIEGKILETRVWEADNLERIVILDDDEDYIYTFKKESKEEIV